MPPPRGWGGRLGRPQNSQVPYSLFKFRVPSSSSEFHSIKFRVPSSSSEFHVLYFNRSQNFSSRTSQHPFTEPFLWGPSHPPVGAPPPPLAKRGHASRPLPGGAASRPVARAAAPGARAPSAAAVRTRRGVRIPRTPLSNPETHLTFWGCFSVDPLPGDWTPPRLVSICSNGVRKTNTATSIQEFRSKRTTPNRTQRSVYGPGPGPHPRHVTTCCHVPGLPHGVTCPGHTRGT